MWKNKLVAGFALTGLTYPSLQERNSDEKLPLLFANKKPATDVKVSATGVLNGSALSGEDGPTSSSAVAVASPSGMILEQEPQPGAADQELDSETEGLIVTVKPSDTEPTPSASPSVSTYIRIY